MIKKIFTFGWEVLKIALIALLIVTPIRLFLFQPFIVSGSSMEPNYHSGDYLIVDSISYRLRNPERGEVIVFRYPEDPSVMHIKRIIGLPGEEVTINGGQIKIISSEKEIFLDESEYLPSSNVVKDIIEITLKEDEYFVLGDNRTASIDSRRWGLLPEKYIIGRSALKVFPLAEFGVCKIPAY